MFPRLRVCSHTRAVYKCPLIFVFACICFHSCTLIGALFRLCFDVFVCVCFHMYALLCVFSSCVRTYVRTEAGPYNTCQSTCHASLVQKTQQKHMPKGSKDMSEFTSDFTAGHMPRTSEHTPEHVPGFMIEYNRQTRCQKACQSNVRISVSAKLAHLSGSHIPKPSEASKRGVSILLPISTTEWGP